MRQGTVIEQLCLGYLYFFKKDLVCVCMCMSVNMYVYLRSYDCHWTPQS